MHILILGAAGMVGRKLLDRLATDGTLAGRPIASVLAHDVVAPSLPRAPFPSRPRRATCRHPARSTRF